MTPILPLDLALHSLTAILHKPTPELWRSTPLASGGHEGTPPSWTLLISEGGGGARTTVGSHWLQLINEIMEGAGDWLGHGNAADSEGVAAQGG